ncbi:hypothetical protein DNTS_021706 [Danionella cerebrum]|uniref:Mitochondrial import receptor subunit TOM7 homolog n=1 Tax=Danionella cerebrum TaxID=2873325 RepID=A0A553P5C5_9TELE|nr:hypothetical protein DNTS_021706 [Danionella translucida]
MVKLSKESKLRLQRVFVCGQFVIRWGFIPTVLYLGQVQARSRSRDAGAHDAEFALGMKMLLMSTTHSEEAPSDGR